MTKKYDLVVIGAGVAGLKACCYLEPKTKDNCKILLLEREDKIGGVQNYTQTNSSLLDKVVNEFSSLKKVTLMLNTTAISIKHKVVKFLSKDTGFGQIKSKSIILATGAYEITQGFLNIPGFRPQGVQTAGFTQYLINHSYNFSSYRNIVVYGKSPSSVDVCNYFDKNVINYQAIDKISLFKIVDIDGKNNITSISLAHISEKGEVLNIEKKECDLLILGCGYKPFITLCEGAKLRINKQTGELLYNKTNYSTSKKGIYALGDCLFVHNNLDEIFIQNEKICSNVLKYLNTKKIFKL